MNYPKVSRDFAIKASKSKGAHLVHFAAGLRDLAAYFLRNCYIDDKEDSKAIQVATGEEEGWDHELVRYLVAIMQDD